MTLELADRDNQKQISCIPKGVYNCDRITSPKFGVCYRVNNVPNRMHILLPPKNCSRNSICIIHLNIDIFLRFLDME